MATATKNPERLLIPPREAAQLLCISPRTLHDLTKSGKIPSVMLGPRGRRYSRAALEREIDRQLKTTTK